MGDQVKIRVGDKVKSPLSLWKGSIGEVSGIIERNHSTKGNWIHVRFPETHEHDGYQDSFDEKDLIVVK